MIGALRRFEAGVLVTQIKAEELSQHFGSGHHSGEVVLADGARIRFSRTVVRDGLVALPLKIGGRVLVGSRVELHVPAVSSDDHLQGAGRAKDIQPSRHSD